MSSQPASQPARCQLKICNIALFFLLRIKFSPLFRNQAAVVFACLLAVVGPVALSGDLMRGGENQEGDGPKEAALGT